MVYLDHHAATPPLAAAEAAMARARAEAWPNPASVHGAGRGARALLESARERVAAAVGARAAEIVLTSGGTEACNLAVFGALCERDPARLHLVSSEVEHPSVAAPLAELERRGAAVTRLRVPEGRPPDPDEVAAAIREDTALCALMWVNHETGTVLPVERYAEVCAERGVPLFVDATQALGKLPIDIARLPGIALLALASHKAGGPAGAGALWLRRGIRLAPQLCGGSQERGLRAGTPDVVSLTGFGVACEAVADRVAAGARLEALRDSLEPRLVGLGATINAAASARVPTVTNASFAGHRGDELVAAMDLEGVCVSSGAACSSGLSEPSPVLRAMYPEESWRASSALRLSFAPETTEIELQTALDALRRVLGRSAA